MIFRLAFFCWNAAAFVFFAVYDDLLYTFLYIVRVLYIHMVSSSAVLSCKREVTEAFRNTWIDAESLVGWLHTQNSLRKIPERPCSGSSQHVRSEGACADLNGY